MVLGIDCGSECRLGSRRAGWWAGNVSCGFLFCFWVLAGVILLSGMWVVVFRLGVVDWCYLSFFFLLTCFSGW